MTDRSRISADEAISEIEEARIDTPATRAAFGDPGTAGVEAVADIPFPLQRIDDPPELDDELEEDSENGADITGANVTPEQEEAAVAAKFRCTFPGCKHEPFDTKQGRSRHETVVHGENRLLDPSPRRGRSKRHRATPETEIPSESYARAGTDELDRIRGIILAIGELSPTGRAFLLEQVAGE